MSFDNFSNYLCEKCKSENALFYCYECNPFHFFCQKCDNSIHLNSMKLNHNRKNILENSKNHILYSPLINKNDIKITSPSQFSQNNNYISKEKDINNFFNNSINFSDEINSQNNQINQLYTKEFVTELKRLCEKEKLELKYKINSLQNNLDRLKNAYQNEIKKLQNKVNQDFQNHKIKEKEIYKKKKLIINEKKKKINNLIN